MPPIVVVRPAWRTSCGSGTSMRDIVYTRALEQRGDRDTDPQGVPDERSTDRVADAFEGVVLLDARKINELVEGDPLRCFDVAVDDESPRADIDQGIDDRFVDDVKVG